MWLVYVPFFRALLLGPGAFLPRPEDRRQPPFLDQLYASNGGCSMSICHRLGAGAAVQWGRGGEAGWSAAPPGRLVAHAEGATLLEGHARALARSACFCRAKRGGPPAPSRSSSYWTQWARWNGAELSDRIARPRTLRHARSVAAGQRAAHRAIAFNCATFCRISAAQSALSRPRV